VCAPPRPDPLFFAAAVILLTVGPGLRSCSCSGTGRACFVNRQAMGSSLALLLSYISDLSPALMDDPPVFSPCSQKRRRKRRNVPRNRTQGRSVVEAKRLGPGPPPWAGWVNAATRLDRRQSRTTSAALGGALPTQRCRFQRGVAHGQRCLVGMEGIQERAHGRHEVRQGPRGSFSAFLGRGVRKW